ncbi:translation elongation factor P (EF-P) [Algoriphagus ornithinivorans]|jgi:elongation factor P|uniref:Elongation factor P n=2 Tax=Algoriphagus TaxID=246875 RepID=A0A1I5IY06_9BACT|nr:MULTISPECIES: elongation factor P [Algoriphagus]MAL15562.1 elongation factor P [Algoriphagus sp.]MAN87927.1 elongation factor P [Algoriphagus sp.]QYH39084.1 elongation factor P [Algoriphagus sp. NBT04N3]SFO65445.1 translation elongation factor P (EF-P) [Algoriphagus ornithinivorans]HAH37867.1 elongation factor P [Algoriphagus sp.]|tara:strand:+ start:7688 stop:8251 length:564 start_codon:yes stop_codon:yes gene_type:complete
MASTADFKNGLCLEMNNDIWTIVEFQHVKPGKGAAFVRTKLKSLTSAKTLDKTFNAGEKVTTARVEKRPHQFLYKDDMGYNFMDTNTFEQIMIEEKLIERSDLLKDGQLVDILIHDETETPLSVELPPFVELMITYTEPGIKGDTATNALKPATVETGATVMVPLFVDQDTMIKVDTRDGSYSERVK